MVGRKRPAGATEEDTLDGAVKKQSSRHRDPSPNAHSDERALFPGCSLLAVAQITKRTYQVPCFQ